MHGRNDGITKISTAGTQRILSGIPRDKVVLITSLGKDWKDIEDGIVRTVCEVLKTAVRIYGHVAITEDLPLLLEEPDQYAKIAHQSYIKRATSDSPQLLNATRIRLLFPDIEFSDEDMRAILRHAAEQVKRTPDEPKLIVASTGADLVVTFAT